MPENYDICKRTFNFSKTIVNFVLTNLKFQPLSILGHQMLRSGTSVGANIEEAQDASSRKEFIRCMTIALKEARETSYWIKLINETSKTEFGSIESIIKENHEIIKILTAIVKKAKSNSNR